MYLSCMIDYDVGIVSGAATAWLGTMGQLLFIDSVITGNVQGSLCVNGTCETTELLCCSHHYQWSISGSMLLTMLFLGKITSMGLNA
jgi:hypothetical protein